ncbi:MAG: WcbI family polysaccharide biosynthesis putative acetyltransferase [Prochlorococcaceae cyanobacterium]
MVRIAITGNCQARPLAEAIRRIGINTEITSTIIVHLVQDEDEALHAENLRSSDLIFAQRVTDGYPCKFVRLSALRAKYPGKVLSFPNLYCSSYNPELTYVRTSGKRPLAGPFGDYHIKTLHDAFLKGSSVDNAVQSHLDPDYNEAVYGLAVEKSLEELRQRELDTDIQISEWIQQHLWMQRLFFTFNHPSYRLICELACRLLVSAAIPMLTPAQCPSVQNEPLGRYRCQPNAWIRRQHGFSFSNEPDYIGSAIHFEKDGNHKPGEIQHYSTQEIAECYFLIYDRFLNKLHSSNP